MTSDTIDMRPFIDKAARQQRDRPTQPLIWIGWVLLSAGGVPACWLAISGHAARDGYSPILLSVAGGGMIFVAVAFGTRIVQRTRIREAAAQRERVRKDIAELVTAAGLDWVRRQYWLRDQIEERLDEISRVQASTLLEVTRLREELAGVRERVMWHVPRPRRRRRHPPKPGVADATGIDPTSPKYLADMSEAVRLGQEIERRKQQPPDDPNSTC